MKLNKNGFTLIELLAMLTVLGILMGVTIPNIIGISTQNKITTYGEDAKKFKNTVEYLLRGDDQVKKPEINNHCVVVNLRYVHSNDYDNPPYGGKYDMDQSYVVMVKKSNEYKFYVQLVEKVDSSNYKGFALVDYARLEGDGYFDNFTEGSSLTSFKKITNWSNSSTIRTNVASTGCTVLDEKYYAAAAAGS